VAEDLIKTEHVRVARTVAPVGQQPFELLFEDSNSLAAAFNGLTTDQKTAAPRSRSNTHIGRDAGAVNVTFTTRDFELAQELEEVGKHFEDEYYQNEYPDIGLSRSELLRHFCTLGWREGRNPNPFFDTVSYLLAHTDVARSRINPYYHYLRHGLTEGRMACSSISPSIRSRLLFGISIYDWVERLAPHIDADFYKDQLDDPDAVKINLAAHFAYRGWREGKSPNASFDVAAWLQAHPAAMRFAVNPLLIQLEAKTNRFDLGSMAENDVIDAPPLADLTLETSTSMESPTGGIDAKPGHRNEILTSDRERLSIVAGEFSATYYLAAYPDVANAKIEPLTHFFYTGWREGRNPNLQFDTGYYLGANDDVREAGVNPFWHYLTCGRAEGRLPRRPGGYRRQIIDAAIEPEQRPLPVVEPNEARLSPVALLRKLAVCVKRNRTLVISLSHDCYTKVIGGTQIFIADEQSRFNSFDCAYVHISPRIPRLSLAEHDPEFSVRVVIDGKLLGIAALSAVISALGRIRSEKNIGGSMLVIHSVLGFHVPDVICLASTFRAAHRIYWLHDYSSVCAGFNLLRNDVEFCGAPPEESPACRVCVYGRTRRQHVQSMQNLFSACEFDVLSPSELTLKMWLKSIDLPAKSHRIHPHWELVANRARSKKRPNRRARKSVNVAFVGFPSANKGWPLFSEMVQRFNRDPRYKFFHFAARNTPSLPNVTFVQSEVTPSDRHATKRLLASKAIDLVLMLSPWPETFSFVAHEAIAAGAKIVCLSDSGNVAALVSALKCGKVLPNAESLATFFESGAAVSLVKTSERAQISYKVAQIGTTATLKEIAKLVRKAAP